MKKYIFFLGGYDAEMCEIKKILDNHNQKYFDKKLSWGAKLSEYDDELRNITNNHISAFIELNLDSNYPENSIIIDHHNEKSGKDKSTSIEQIADLLGIELTRWQKLISINDKGWIPAMIEYSASKKEIEKIRAYDRECQGVKREDEELALKAIENQTVFENLILIESKTNRTSPIIDRLFGKFKNILIFTPESTEFTGDGSIVLQLKTQFPECWYGGNLPEFGFWGMNKVDKNILRFIRKENK